MKSDSIVVARRAGKVVGCVAIQRRADFAYTRRLAVEPEERGCGLGRALMAEAKTLARHLGFCRLRVETRLVLAANRAFFQALGFAEGAQRSLPGFAHPTYVELEKTLI